MQRHNQLRRGDNRVRSALRHRRMAAFAGQGNFKRVERGHHRPAADRHLAQRHTRPVVQRVNGIHREALKQPLLYHFPRAAQVLLGGLENKVHGTAKAAGLRQMRRCRQQNRAMTIMAAGVHHARIARFIADIALLGDRQRVHIGPQANHRTGAVLQGRDHAGTRQPAMHLEAKRREQFSHPTRGLLFLIPQLRASMKITSPANGLGDQ